MGGSLVHSPFSLRPSTNRLLVSLACRDVLPLPLRLPATLQRLGRAELDACAALGMSECSPQGDFTPSQGLPEEAGHLHLGEGRGGGNGVMSAPKLLPCAAHPLPAPPSPSLHLPPPGSVVEAALYKCVLKPLRDCIYGQLLEFHSRDGSLQKLRDHQLSMGRQSLAELGVTASVPDAPALERIQAKLLQMHQAYSPKKKEAQLLKACKLIYEAMNHGTGEIYGADDFLPVLTYVLVKCDIVAVQLDVEYMMELLDPSQLQGEGGYYLTTWFGALYHISNFQSAMVTRQISTEAQDSIHRWQRRRTIHHNQHNRRRSQVEDILYVSFQEPFTNQKAISVPAHMTAASVCMICSKKYGVSNPEAYGLFLVTDSTSQLLAGDSRPQQIRSASLKSHSASSCFVYKLKGEEPEAPLEGDGPTPAQDPM
uniref:Ras and Rab interactor 3 n=1 Tax=Chelonoidis abingdonii TaxID=106734 RepID=A0A8C0GRA5_CHEAB